MCYCQFDWKKLTYQIRGICRLQTNKFFCINSLTIKVSFWSPLYEVHILSHQATKYRLVAV